MKLNEAIQFNHQPLFESFKDLKRILIDTVMREADGDVDYEAAIEEIMYNNSTLFNVVWDFNNIVSKMSTNGIDIPSDNLESPDGVFDVLEWIIRHRGLQSREDVQYRNLSDTGRWISILRGENGLITMFRTMNQILVGLNRFEEDPQRKKAEFREVVKTPDYEVFELVNFMAARKLCNMFKTNFCIGANPKFFDSYGDRKGLGTYAITLPNRTVVIVHMSEKGFLITSNDNRSDINDRLSTHGAGERGIVEDFVRAGLDEDQMIDALMSVIPPRFEEVVEEIISYGMDQLG